MFRELSANRSREMLLKNLATGLSELSDLCAARSLETEALETAEEAAEVRRGLGRENYQQTKALIDTWTTLAQRHDEFGSTEGSIAAKEEIAEIYRGWPPSPPSHTDLFYYQMAYRFYECRPRFLRDLGKRYAQVGRNEEAVSVTREALDLYKHFPEREAEKYEFDRILTMQALSNRYREAGNQEMAIIAEEAVEMACRQGLAPRAWKEAIAEAAAGL